VNRRIYLDANATVEPLDSVVEEVIRTMRAGAGNPASAHAAGAQARQLVERSRDAVCGLVESSDPEGVVFVSGGTEANNTVLAALARQEQTVFLAAPVEHASILKPLAGLAGRGRMLSLPVDSCGRVDPDGAARLAGEGAPVVLAIQAANSETGVVQPVAEVVRAVRARRPEAFVLLDAAQALGRVPIDLAGLDVDAVSFSGHKLHGPAGTGALVLRAGADERINPLILGGGQERGLRAGTLNVPGIAGLAAALRQRRDRFDEAVSALRAVRDAFEARLVDRLGPRVAFNGAAAPRVANTTNARFAGVDGMRLLALLDERGVMASQGSACSSGRPEPSATLSAMGLGATDAFASLRFSFSILNTVAEALQAADIAAGIVREIAA
jgi:cysteine desulfurase